MLDSFEKKDFTLNTLGELEVFSSPSSSQDDFDFLQGQWTIHNRKLKSRLDHCKAWTEFEARGELRKILNGRGNIDNFITTLDGKPFEGMSLRLFNPKSRLWSIYWADSTAVVLDKPVVGSFENTVGKFYTKDIFNGIEIIVMFNWNKTDPFNPIWSQAFSVDEGKTWEWNWYMMFRKS